MRLPILCLLFLMVHSTISADIYCSSSTGSDSNPGTLQLPVKTIKRAIEKNYNLPTYILLKKGDIFYENVKLPLGQKIGAYSYNSSSDSKPVISGMRILTCPWVRGEFLNGVWREDENGKVWRYALTYQEAYFVKCFDTGGGSSELNNIGSLINPNTKQLYSCRRVKYPSQLSVNFDFYQSVIPKQENDISSLDYLYCYYDGDAMPPMAVPAGCTGVELSIGSVLKDVRVEFFGHHGISPGQSSWVSNCEVFGIGGKIQYLDLREVTNDKGELKPKYPWVCLGNGIEVYVKKENTVSNITVENCHVSDCFDCGLSLQGGNRDLPATTGTKAVNVVFQNNVVTHCLQGWESFLYNPSKFNFKYENCYVKHNLFVNNGRTTPFRYIDDETDSSSLTYLPAWEILDGMKILISNEMRRRRNRCQMLSTAEYPSGMIVEDNTFAGHNYLSAYKQILTIDTIQVSPIKPLGFYPDLTLFPIPYNNQIYNRNLIILYPEDYLLLNSTHHYPECLIPPLGLSNFSTLLTESIARFREYTSDETSVIKVIGYDLNIEKFPYTLEQAEELRWDYNLNTF